MGQSHPAHSMDLETPHPLTLTLPIRPAALPPCLPAWRRLMMFADRLGGSAPVAQVSHIQGLHCWKMVEKKEECYNVKI